MNKQTSRQSRTALTAALFLGLLTTAACGDPVRSSYYDGEPLISVRGRLVGPGDDLANGMTEVWLYDAKGAPDVERLPIDGDENGFVFDVPTHVQPAPENDSKTPSLLVLELHVKTETSTEQLGFVAPNYWLIYAGSTHVAYPSGLAGPAVNLEKGYQLVKRHCDGSLEVVPDTTVLEFVPNPPSGPMSTARFMERCGVSLHAEEKGRIVSQATAADLDFLPGVDATIIYADHHYTDSLNPRLDWPSQLTALRLADLAMTRLATSVSYFQVPVSVSPDGNSVRVWADQNQKGRIDLVEVDSQSDHESSVRTLLADVGYGNQVLSSPDHRVLARTSLTLPLQTLRYDTTTQGSVQLQGRALALSNGSDVLVERPVGGPSPKQAYEWVITGVEGDKVSLGARPAADEDCSPYCTWADDQNPNIASHLSYVWNEQGPQVFIRWHDGRLEWRSLLTGEVRFPLGATVVNSAPEPVRFASNGNVALIWTRTCWDLQQEFCDATLHQVSLIDGTSKAIARTRQPSIVALSPDETQIALGQPDGIFVKQTAAVSP